MTNPAPPDILRNKTSLMKHVSRLYERWIRAKENHLCFRATNRVVRHFDWGLEWSHNWPCTRRHPKNGDAPEDYLTTLNRQAMLDSHEFFGYETPRDFELQDRILRFTSPVVTPYPETTGFMPSGSRPKPLTARPWFCYPIGTHLPTGITRSAAA